MILTLKEREIGAFKGGRLGRFSAIRLSVGLYACLGCWVLCLIVLAIVLIVLLVAVLELQLSLGHALSFAAILLNVQLFSHFAILYLFSQLLIPKSR